MKKLVFLLSISIVIHVPLLCTSLSSPDTSKIKTEIQTVLNKQKTEWNEGNIEGFMEYYWNSEHFTFQSGDSRIYGWQTLLSRYKKNYSGENQGTLDFHDIDIKVLSNEAAYVLGRWKLIQKDTPQGGVFTLIFQRMPEGWKIIHDHTS